MFKRIVFLVISGLFIMGCESSSESKTVYQEVLSYKTPCIGVEQMLCLTSTNATTGNIELFYGAIEGFEFVWGHSYQLNVLEIKIANPPADGANIKYRLENVISSQEDEVGTRYEYVLVELLENTFTQEAGNYYFLNQPFECHVAVDCDSLVNINNSGGLVNIYFGYLGGGKISLLHWD
jgi:hypothetical protein